MNDAEIMIDKKLRACRKAYEEEFEHLARQFEALNIEVDEQRRKWVNVQTLVSA